MRIMDIVPDTIVDGPHYRTAIYFSGCKHRCPGCHNSESWNLDSGKDYTIQEVVDLVKKYDHLHVTLSGGDVFCYQPKEGYELCKELKKQIPGISIWGYTGYTMSELLDEGDEYKIKLLNELDGLVDGRFIESEKSKDLLYRGSKNQVIWTRDSNGEFQINNELMR